jgi:hypothetical protein
VNERIEAAFKEWNVVVETEGAADGALVGHDRHHDRGGLTYEIRYCSRNHITASSKSACGGAT